ncbi:MAG: hypothetical protein ABIG89_03870 [Candidatus Woesearchaeota archaeon]
MMYQSERMYVKMQRTQTFSFYASRSMIADGSIDNLISNYAESQSHTSRRGVVYNMDAPLSVIESRPIEQKLLEYRAAQSTSNQPYTSFNYNPLSYLTRTQPAGEYFMPNNFLNLYRPDTQFIDNAKEVEENVKRAFRQTTGEELPEHISITICEKDKFKLIHESNGGRWSPGIQGFTVHMTNQIVVKQNKLDVVMLVLGHELGHVLSRPLNNAHDEEAKAFAFELAWMKAIKENNIANLAENINIDFKPANNGLHDVAFNFVRKLVNAGKRAMDVFKGLIDGRVSMKF